MQEDNYDKANFEREAGIIQEEIIELLRGWANRDADGLVVCTFLISHMVATAGALFDSPQDYDAFIARSVENGKKMFIKRINGEYNVH